MAAIENARKEIEIKLDLGSFTNYLKLLGFLGQIDSEQHQLNCYFDTADQKLKNEGWALRVRLENEQGVVTLKSTTTAQGSAAIRDEIESEVPRDRAYAVIHNQMAVADLEAEPIRTVLDQFGDLPLEKIVQFSNTRQYKRQRIHDQNYTFEVDKTEFADGSVDYELEIELSEDVYVDQVETYLRRLFDTLDIPYAHQPASKLARALGRS